MAFSVVLAVDHSCTQLLAMDQEAQVLVRRLRLAAFSRKLINRATPLIRAANLHPHPYPSTARTTAIPRLSLKQSSQPPFVRQLIPNKEWALSLFKKSRAGHNIVGVFPFGQAGTLDE
jgi:hypothetical protein